MKTTKTDEKVSSFLDSLDDSEQKSDSEKLVEMMSEISKADAVMWGSSIIGFGNSRLVYDSGKELDWFKIGFSPRKGKIALYITNDAEEYKQDLQHIGKLTTGKSCIYVHKLSDVDVDKLKTLIQKAYNK